MSNVMTQVANVVTNVSAPGGGSTLYTVAQVPAATAWLIHAANWARIIAGTNPGNITDVSFWWTTSADVKLFKIATGALPVLWANNVLSPFNTFTLDNQEKVRIEVTATAVATVDLRTIIGAVVIT